MAAQTTARTGPRRTRISSRGITPPVPHNATGTTGAPVRNDNQAAPGRSGDSPHSATRLPSGNTPTAPPARKCRTAARKAPSGTPLSLGRGMAPKVASVQSSGRRWPHNSSKAKKRTGRRRAKPAISGSAKEK